MQTLKNREIDNFNQSDFFQVFSPEETQMELSEVQAKLQQIEADLSLSAFSIFHSFCRNERVINVGITMRLKKRALKDRVWKSKAMLKALKNAEYGFDEKQARSRGGFDGIFLIDRHFTPKNEMMKKLFDNFLDQPKSGVMEIATALDIEPSALLPVRVVSHHLRLLGVLYRAETEDWLILVDCDISQ